jgi:diguanylate cyclase (GGDEF)-like protein
MNRNSTDRQASLIGGRNGPYCFELGYGTVVSSQRDPAGTRVPCDGVAPRSPSIPTAHRLDSELWRMVLTDKLTGLCNEHGFIALAEQQWRVSRRTDREMVFVGLDLEGLPERRENHPRGEADLTLIAAGRVLMKTFRRSDVLCRWGGDEFRVLAVNGEGLEESMLRARIQYQLGKAGAPVADYPLVFRGRIVRIDPKLAGSFADITARIDEDFALFRRTWCGSTASGPILVSPDAPRK